MTTPHLQLFLSSSPAPISAAARKISRKRYERQHSHTAPTVTSTADSTQSAQFGRCLLHLISHSPLSFAPYSLFRSRECVTAFRRGAVKTFPDSVTNCFRKTLYRNGFDYCVATSDAIDEDDWQDSIIKALRRTILYVRRIFHLWIYEFANKII